MSKLETGEAAGAIGEEAFFVALSLDDDGVSFLVVPIVFGETFDDGATEVAVGDNGLEETISTDFEDLPLALVLPGERTELSEDEDGAGEEFVIFWVPTFSNTTDTLFWLDRALLRPSARYRWHPCVSPCADPHRKVVPPFGRRTGAAATFSAISGIPWVHP